MNKPPLDPHNLIPQLARGELKTMRQSTMGSADICLKRVGYDLDPTVKKGTGEARIVGTAYHAGLEALYGARMRGEEPTPKGIEDAALASFEDESGDFSGWDTSREEARGRVTALLDRYQIDQCEWGGEWEVLGVEQEWFLPLGNGYAIKGTIDLILRDGSSGELVLVDHKTAKRKWPQGKEHPRKNNQSPLYCWAWWTLTGEQPDAFVFDVMTYKGELERRWGHPTPEQMTNVLSKAVGLATLLDRMPAELLPANTTSALCSSQFCDFWSLCPFGQASVS